jgi:hypothetical protein
MPRKPRFVIPGVPVHIVQRGHSREPVFFEDSDYLAYWRWVKEGAARYRVSIHAYVLMTNHIHILATPEETTKEDFLDRLGIGEDAVKTYSSPDGDIKLYEGLNIDVRYVDPPPARPEEDLVLEELF